uniref:Ephrin RBD domain-containing protein n=1 Tax=Mesocestoides corti TaxID=53468 RepID=A0A5K3EJE6_MESCO
LDILPIINSAGNQARVEDSFTFEGKVVLCGVEYPSPNRKNTSTTGHALLTNQKPEPHVRRLPSESTMLSTPLILYCSSVVSFSGWLLIFLACYWNTERHRIGCGQVVQYVYAHRRRHCGVKSGRNDAGIQ